MKVTRRHSRGWIRAVVVLQIVGLLVLAAAGSALAKDSSAAAPASCMGHEASDISPPGSSDEVPGGMPALKAFVNGEFPGVPLGVIYRQIARLHEGSHQACDEALEG